ncbi:beta-lactamase family protein [Nonomuraea sp. NBC_01738]|uniref:serine hydrolase domain-containing protein n=1 Tax=Nonomuraea sp. NBC_01738 TaxID=2976003 RepID=UPI002E111F93|nr:beta-lactamase family protein [Nonomuraea sp. NBC_01738]
MYCDPRFRRVREVFERQFAEGEELGAAVAVHVDGELVVDLWGGVADRHTGRAWERDTPVFAYSCTKALTATVALNVLDDVTVPVRDLWPEFGDPSVTVEHLLTHQAGLPVVEEQVPVAEFEDLPAIADRLARQRPLWEPGTAHGYHALTYGFLVGEVVRRVSGRSVGELVAERFAAPYGLEVWVGAPEDVIARTARLTAGDRVSGGTASAGTGTAGTATASGGALPEMLDPQSLMNRALGNPGMHRLKGGANHPVILRAGWPGAGLVATARGLAGFYQALIDGLLLPEATLKDALRQRVRGPDRVLLIDSGFGLGYAVPSGTFPAPRGSVEAFGHRGMGGSLGLADLGRRVTIGYVPNRLSGGMTIDLRAHRLAEAVYACL